MKSSSEQVVTALPEQNQKGESFSYTYSALRQEEILAIRKKYLSSEIKVDPLEQLQKLDNRANLPGLVIAILLGLVGTVLFCIGLCYVMIESWHAYLGQGVVIGCLGLILMAIACPVDYFVTKQVRKQIAPKILALTDELLKIR
jgi:hypothetical protein